MPVYVRGCARAASSDLAGDRERLCADCRDDNGYAEASYDVWNVQQSCQPDRGGSYRRSNGSADANAVHTCVCCAMGGWVAYGAYMLKACAE